MEGKKMKIGDRIKNLRESLKITQSELANHLNTTKQTIYKYENNIVTNIPIDKIEKLSDILKTSPAYLMGWDDENKNLEFDIFEELLALSNWEYKTIPCCETVGINRWLDEEDKVPCYDGKDIHKDCDNCEYNKDSYYLTNGKQYFKITEEEFNELCYCIKPYFNFRINELISKKRSLSKQEFDLE